jgi:hypothetical protein
MKDVKVNAEDFLVDKFPIFMVDRGNCSFVTKVRNIQNAGGHLALIVDNKDDDVNNILMVDDGTGSDIHIPAVLILKSDGDKIKNYMNSTDYNGEDIVLAVEFQIVKNI